MTTYRYIGADPSLRRMTALGRTIGGVFKVQVDDLSHHWSRSWHASPREEWCDMVQYRAATERDAHYLLDIDIKCFDYAWMPEDWRKVSLNCVACVAVWNDAPIGMAIFARTNEGDVEIVKIAVKEPFRNQGIGRHLINNCVLYAREINAPSLVMIVPEGRLRPGDPDDLSRWFPRLGFRARSPLLKDRFSFYGKTEDAVLFILPVYQQSSDVGGRAALDDR